MRLLNTTTLALESFPSRPPPYAILSHTWLTEEGAEPTLRDVLAGTHTDKPGWAKIVDFCRAVASTGLIYAWADTVCIDKTSSAELSEAINAMFRWYRRADCCFAYLADVPDVDRYAEASEPGQGTVNEPGPAFERSRWFTRGWTLQVLLAPRRVTFFSQSWRRIGTRASLAQRISTRTRIPVPVLLTGSWRRDASAHAAARMSWAAGRATTRPEDAAYCLLGLFGIHMPLLYGEGGPRAFVRLQEEVLRRGEDCSLLVWDASALEDGDFADDDDDDGYVDDYEGGERRRMVVGALAPRADCFADSGNIACHPASPDAPDSVITSTSRGLSVQMCVMTREDGPPDERLGVLPCHVRGDMATVIALPLVPLDTAGSAGSMAVGMPTQTYARARAAPVVLPMVLPALAWQAVLLPRQSSWGPGPTEGRVVARSDTTWWLKYFSGNSCDLLGSWTAPWPDAASSSEPFPPSPWQSDPSPPPSPCLASPSSPLSWTRNDPTQTMTLLIPQTIMTARGKSLPLPGPVSSVAAFRVRGREEYFAVRMELGPGDGTARVELSALNGAPHQDEDMLQLVKGGGAGLTVLELPSATISVRFSIDDVRGTLTNVVNVICMRPLGRS